MTTLILLSLGLIHLNQYSFKGFEHFRMAVNRSSLVDEATSLTIFLEIPPINFLLDLDPNCIVAVTLILYAFLEEKFYYSSPNVICNLGQRCIVDQQLLILQVSSHHVTDLELSEGLYRLVLIPYSIKLS